MPKTEPLSDADETAPQAAPATAHRAEIDGLRAIAVLAVVFYHFGVPGVGGGFVGVDIFFVISGFLIGGILWREKQATGRLALGAFFMRRIRRLAPAYFVMAAAVLAVGASILLPGDFRETAKGVIAATVYLSNILFFRQSGYFDGAAEDKLMLHTWSLSVEEQFYLFLPLLFLVFGRSKTLMIWALGACFAGSLLSSIPMTFQAHTAAFYLFPFRAWELLAGVGLAVMVQEKPALWRPAQGYSWAGLALILGAAVLTVPGPAFPGWQVLAPVAGTLLLLANGQHDNWVNRGLSMRVPVLIGLMSYSLYLWHWPVFAFSTYLRGDYAGPAEAALWIAISMVLGALSWRLVEHPVRRARSLPNWALLSGAVTASALLLASSALVFRTDGLPTRFDVQTRLHIAATEDFIQDFSRCDVRVSGRFSGLEVCQIGPQDRLPSLLIWGDSHLRAYFEGLDQAAHETDRAALVIWRAGCAPVFNLQKRENTSTVAQNAACALANATLRAALDDMPELRDVLLVGRWSYYATGQGSGTDAHNTITLRSEVYGPMAQEVLLQRALTETVQDISLQDRAVYVLRQPPEITDYKASTVARALAHKRITPKDARRVGQVTMIHASVRAALGDAAIQASGAQVIDTWPWFCGPFLCDAVHSGVGQYFDNNHVTNSAARRIRAIFYPVLARQRP